MSPKEVVCFFIGMIVGVAFTVLTFFGSRVVAPWIRSLFSGGQVSLIQVLGMTLRGNPASLLVDTHLRLLHGAGLRIGIADVERKYLAHRGEIATCGDLVDLFLASHQPADNAAEPKLTNVDRA